MRRVRLGHGAAASRIELSELGFGCAAMGGRSSRKQSFAAVSAAWDAGINFFDTARSYGYGQSESLLGEFLKGKRQNAVVCTKFGILPSPQNTWKQKVKPLARGAVKLFPGLRKAIRRQISDQFVTGVFSPQALQSSLNTSLHELKTDYVDILLFHAAPLSILERDDLMESLSRFVETGKVRTVGISGDLPVIEKYFKTRPVPLTTAQFALNLSNIDFVGQTRQNSDLFLVANHPYGGPLGAASGPTTVKELRDLVDFPIELRQKLDPHDPQVLPELVLNLILLGTGVSAVVPAMMQSRHIASNFRAIENCRFSAGELDAIRTYLVSRSKA